MHFFLESKNLFSTLYSTFFFPSKPSFKLFLFMFVAKNILTHQPEELFATNQDHAMAHKELVRLDFCRKQMIFLENEVSTWIWTRALSRFGKMPKLQIFYWDQWLGSSFLRFGSSFLGRHTDWELRHIPSRLSQISVLFAFNQYHFDCQRNAASQGAIDIHSSHICVILIFSNTQI